MTQSFVVGLASIVVAIYNLILAIIHIRIKHNAAKTVSRISCASSILLFWSVLAITLSYYVPIIAGYCMCQIFFSTALFLYVSSVFLMKFMYLQRVKLFNDEPILKRPRVGIYIKMVTLSLSGSVATCLYLMIFHTNGECFAEELLMTEYGCITSFEIIDLQLALGMIFIDIILFGMFCSKWWNIVKVLKLSEPNNRIPASIWQGFAMQFICVTVAMTSCSIDGIINYLYMDYDTLLVFVVDCAIVSTANFAMLKESQQFLGKQLRTILCIDMLRFLERAESVQNIKNLDPAVNDDDNNGGSPITDSSNQTMWLSPNVSLAKLRVMIPMTVPSDTNVTLTKPESGSGSTNCSPTELDTPSPI